jgi:hypothetical protein
MWKPASDAPAETYELPTAASAERRKPEPRPGDDFVAIQRMLLSQPAGNVPISAELRGTYEVRDDSPAAGKSYFVIPCEHCGCDTPIFEDVTEGRSDIRFGGEGRVIVTCARCARSTGARPNQFRVAKWAVWLFFFAAASASLPNP